MLLYPVVYIYLLQISRYRVSRAKHQTSYYNENMFPENLLYTVQILTHSIQFFILIYLVLILFQDNRVTHLLCNIQRVPYLFPLKAIKLKFRSNNPWDRLTAVKLINRVPSLEGSLDP